MKVNETCELSEEFNIVFVHKALFCEHKFSNGIVKTIDPVDYWDFKNGVCNFYIVKKLRNVSRFKEIINNNKFLND